MEVTKEEYMKMYGLKSKQAADYRIKRDGLKTRKEKRKVTTEQWVTIVTIKEGE